MLRSEHTREAKPSADAPRYMIQHHMREVEYRADSPNPGLDVYAVTIWSERRQGIKRLRRRLGLSGRQWVKHRKALQRYARAKVKAEATQTGGVQ